MYAGPVLITGCSRGLGLEMVKQLSKGHGKLRPELIIATCRSPDSAQDLQEVAEQNPDVVKIKKLDVTEYGTFKPFVEDIKPMTNDKGIGMLINNAANHPTFNKITGVTADEMSDTFAVNVVGPLLLTKELLSLLKVNSKKAKAEGAETALIVNMSTALGSISKNKGMGGGIYPYRICKAGQNAMTKNFSEEFASFFIRSLAFYPGWVKTDLGGQKAPLSPEESVRGLLDLLDNFDTKTHNGNFFDYTGKALPW